MDIFFIGLFIVSALATFFSPAGILGMVTLVAWIISVIYLGFRYHKNFTAFINDLF